MKQGKGVAMTLHFIGTALVVSAAVLAAAPASAQLTIPGLELPVKIPVRQTLTYPCNWIETIHYQRRNTGYPETHANYQVSAMPILPPPGAVIRVSGQYPKARYFTFSVYDGFRPGNLLDTLEDWQLTPRLNGVPLAPPLRFPAQIPDSGNHSYTWQVTLKYTPPPANRADREPDTVYMSDDQVRYFGFTIPNVFGNKQFGMRTYLPDAGQDEFGGVPLPTITYTAPDGTVVDARNNPDQDECDSLDRGQDILLTVFPQVRQSGTGNTDWKPDTTNETFHFYPNGGTNYFRGPASKFNADMVIARFKAPLHPDAYPDTAQVRYTSLCQNQYNNTAVVACLADREFTVYPDGSVITVISTNARRPVRAQPSFGFNWLPWGPASEALVYLRQITPNPLFVGNYDLAISQPNRPLAETLGEWAPELTYCDRQTFEANSLNPDGGALIRACKANYRPYKNGINLSN